MNRRKIKILNIVGARPNFMKMAPLYRIYRQNENLIRPILVHTKQHTDKKMSGIFFESLDLPEPEYSLSTNALSPIALMAQIMAQLQEILTREKPDIVLVVGDVNSTLAAALTANKNEIKVAHVEAGLRSRDRTMPEEINRILTDNISDWLFVSEQSGLVNLKNENIDASRIFFTGNVMIDNLIQMLPKINISDVKKKLGLKDNYVLMTMHRPVNVDTESGLRSMQKIIEIVIKKDLQIVFPIHPRTLKNLNLYPDVMAKISATQGLIITEPMEYIDFLSLVKDSTFVLTDSGGIQEEAAFLKVPTITLRESTERPSTIECGANHICPPGDNDLFIENIQQVLQMRKSDIKDVPLNDGKASERIINILLQEL